MGFREEQVREFIIETRIPMQVLAEKYPELKFASLGGNLGIVEIPESLLDIVDILRKDTTVFYMPDLYGLNAEAGLNDSNINFLHNYPLGELRGRDILIAFVDTGIDYTNDLFRYEDNTTRIAFLWDQTEEGNAPKRYNYGTEYTEQQINEALSSPNPYDIVPSKDEIGHGTFLAGVAGGNDRIGDSGYIGAAPDATFVIVKLRPARRYWRELYLVEPETAAYQTTDVLQGINYVLDKANELGKPIAICIGIGSNQGPHEGSTGVERYLQELTMYENVILASAAGNEANKGHHFSGTIQSGGVENIEVNVATDESGFILQLWCRNADKLAMAITTPLGEKVEKVPLTINQLVDFTFPLEASTISFQYQNREPEIGSQLIAVRVSNPTPGLWNFIVYGEFVIEGTFNVWLPREGFVKENTRFTRSDANITVCIPSTAKDLIVVGGYDYIDQSIYAASGRGPTTDNIIKPDIIAPAVNVRGPKPGGGFTTYVGTSVAAAITTGANALLLQWAQSQKTPIYINTRVARIILIRGARRSRNQPYPNNVEGYGKLDLKNSLSLI